MLPWGLLGAGAFLMWAAVTGRSPAGTIQAVFSRQPLPPGKPLVKSTTFEKTVGTGIGPNATGTWAERKQGVVNVALAQLGKPYQWGAEGPDRFDCSGLTQYAYRNGAQQVIPRTAALQAGMATRTSTPVNGDLVFLGVPAYHCGVWYGGQYINAPDRGQVVKVSQIPRGAYFGRFF